jgi:hypothetical protein
MPRSVKFPIRELRLAGVSGWEINKFGNRRSAQECVDSVRLMRLQSLVIALLEEAREAAMLIRSYYLHYRLIREAIIAVATVGAALLFSYLILQA